MTKLQTLLAAYKSAVADVIANNGAAEDNEERTRRLARRLDRAAVAIAKYKPANGRELGEKLRIMFEEWAMYADADDAPNRGHYLLSDCTMDEFRERCARDVAKHFGHAQVGAPSPILPIREAA